MITPISMEPKLRLVLKSFPNERETTHTNIRFTYLRIKDKIGTEVLGY
jgi:hypothetical protein